jgi:ubiquinone/menaquinone biosynthesis C-methylase UbiE
MVTVKQFYDELQFPGPYTLNDLTNYGKLIPNKYLQVIDQHIKSKQTVLDAGCGTGLITNLFALRNPTASFVGVDFADSLDYAERFARQNKLTNTTFVNEDLVTFTTNKKFDIVVCQGVLHHIPQYKLVLDKLANLVDTEGKLILGLYHPNGKLLKKFMRIRYNSDILYEDQELNPLEFSFTYNEVQQLLPDWKIVSASPNILGNVSVPALFNSSNGGLVIYVLEKINETRT